MTLKTAKHQQRPWLRAVLIGGAVVLALAAVSGWSGSSVPPIGTTFPISAAASQPGPVHPVELVGLPETPLAVEVSAPSGEPTRVACGTCHSLRGAQPLRRDAPDRFHQGLTFAHGDLACQSCHASPEYDRFRLADGRTVAPEQVMRLCGQCHGTQKRDYDHGAHGGMNGYWDRSRGPRQRNACTVCHDPHAPRYQGMVPAPRARDRFLGGAH